MSNLSDEILESINKFRSDPNSIAKECSLFLMVLRRLKPNDPFLQEIEIFIKGLESLPPMKPLVLNKDLCNYANIEFEKFKSEPSSFPLAKRGVECYRLVSDSYLGENPGIIYDYGAEAPSDVCPRILVNRDDKKKVGRYLLCCPDYTQIGIASEIIGGEIYMTFVLALNSTDDKNMGDQLDLTDLKQAFDLFDYHKEGRIRINDTLESMKELEIDISDPALFQIMNELSGNKYVSWPIFAEKFIKRLTDTKTEKGLNDIFELFIDNIKKDTINTEILKNICNSIGRNISEFELLELINVATKNKSEISFEDFCKLMKS